jgi:hypothetical protein
MPNKLNITEEVLNKLIENVLNVQCEHNSQHIVQILLRELPDYTKESILHLACVGKKYEPVYPGDYVKVEPPNYHAGSEFEWDVLTDLKLNPGDGMVYGLVEDDCSWSSDKKYNPFYSMIKVSLMYHDKQSEMKFLEYDFSPVDLIKVAEEDIKYFDIIHQLDA